MGLSDFPCPFIIGVCPWTSRHDPQRHPLWVDTGSPGSRARCFRTCTGSLTARGPGTSRNIDALDVAFRFSLQRRHPGESYFRGSIPGPHVPLSTLRLNPCGVKRMTRGQHGSLLLYCKRLSLSVTHRFAPAHFAVGTPVTRRPPHRSLRAELPHKAPTSGTDAQSLFGIRMKGSHRWEPFRSQSVHALSGNSVALAPSPQRPEPETTHLILESV